MKSELIQSDCIEALRAMKRRQQQFDFGRAAE